MTDEKRPEVPVPPHDEEDPPEDPRFEHPDPPPEPPDETLPAGPDDEDGAHDWPDPPEAGDFIPLQGDEEPSAPVPVKLSYDAQLSTVEEEVVGVAITTWPNAETVSNDEKIKRLDEILHIAVAKTGEPLDGLKLTEAIWDRLREVDPRFTGAFREEILRSNIIAAIAAAEERPKFSKKKAVQTLGAETLHLAIAAFAPRSNTKEGGAEDAPEILLTRAYPGNESFAKRTVARTKDGLVIRRYNLDDRDERRLEEEDIVLEPHRVPGRHRNEHGEERILYDGQSVTRTDFDKIVRIHLSLPSYQTAAVKRWLDNQPFGETIPDALLLGEEEDRFVLKVPRPPKGTAAWDVVQAFHPADNVENAKSRLRRFVEKFLATKFHAEIACYIAGSPIYAVLEPLEILPSLRADGASLAGKTGTAFGATNTFWGFRTGPSGLGLGNDARKSTFRSAAYESATNLPLVYDEVQVNADVEEGDRGRRSRSAVTRGRADLTITRYRPIAPYVDTSNLSLEPSGGIHAVRGTERRTARITAGQDEIDALTPIRAAFTLEKFDTGEGGALLLSLLNEPTGPHREFLRKLQEAGKDGYECIIALGAFALGIQPPEIVRQVADPAGDFLEFLATMVMRYFEIAVTTNLAGTTVSARSDSLATDLRTELFFENEEGAVIRTESATTEPKWAAVIITQAFVDRYVRARVTIGRSPAVRKLADLRGLAPRLGVREDDVYASRTAWVAGSNRKTARVQFGPWAKRPGSKDSPGPMGRDVW